MSTLSFPAFFTYRQAQIHNYLSSSAKFYAYRLDPGTFVSRKRKSNALKLPRGRPSMQHSTLSHNNPTINRPVRECMDSSTVAPRRISSSSSRASTEPISSILTEEDELLHCCVKGWARRVSEQPLCMIVNLYRGPRRSSDLVCPICGTDLAGSTAA